MNTPIITIISISNLQAYWNPFSQGTKTPQIPPAPHILSHAEQFPLFCRNSASVLPSPTPALRPRYFPELLMYIASSRGGFGDPGSTELPDHKTHGKHNHVQIQTGWVVFFFYSPSPGSEIRSFLFSLRVCSQLVLHCRSRDNCNACLDSDCSPVGHWIQLLRRGVLRWVSEN